MLENREFRLEKLNRHRFEQLRFDKAILVTGATEYHAMHLPFGTDTYAAYAVAERTAEQSPGTLLLPPVPFGVSDGLMPAPFTITVTPETLAALIYEAIDSLVNQGIEHVLIINGHGGNNAAINTALRKVKKAFPDSRIAVSYAWWISGPRLCPPGTFGKENGLGHAGEAETSVALHVTPDLVDMDVAKGEWPDMPAEIALNVAIPEYSATGATGDPTDATAEKGRKVVEVLADHLVRFLRELDCTGWKFGLERGEPWQF